MSRWTNRRAQEGDRILVPGCNPDHPMGWSEQFSRCAFVEPSGSSDYGDRSVGAWVTLRCGEPDQQVFDHGDVVVVVAA